MVEVQPAAKLSDQDISQISLAAGRVLKHVSQARDAIHDKKPDQAAKHVEQGLKLLAIIDNVLPHHKIQTNIVSGELAYHDEDVLTPRYVTIFDELDRYDVISPIAQMKSESEAKLPMKSGTASPPGAVAVTHAEARYTAVRLDLIVAGHLLRRTKQDLHDGKTEEADNALHSVQTRAVMFEFDSVDLPLEEAADNLKLAEVEMSEGRTADAKAALHVAVDQLKRYEKLVGEHRGAAVKALHEEIAKLTQELDKSPPSEEERKKLAAQISEWWHSSTKWFKNKTK